MLCVRGGLRWAVVAAVTLVLSPSAYGQQNPALPGVRMIELDGRAVRVQTIGLQDRRPAAPVIVFEAGASNAIEIWGGILPRIAAMAPVVRTAVVGAEVREVLVAGVEAAGEGERRCGEITSLRGQIGQDLLDESADLLDGRTPQLITEVPAAAPR